MYMYTQDIFININRFIRTQYIKEVSYLQNFFFNRPIDLEFSPHFFIYFFNPTDPFFCKQFIIFLPTYRPSFQHLKKYLNHEIK